MSKLVITEKGKKVLTDALFSTKSKEFPFFKEGDKLYFRFNKIVIDNTSSFWGSLEDSDCITVKYCWDDIALFEQKTNGIKFEKGSTLALIGIEGRISVDFNFNT